MSVKGDPNRINMSADAKIPNSVIEKKPQQKIIRVLTVLAYVLSVSLAAIILSIYYIFVWDGRPHIGQSRSLVGIGTQNDTESNLTTMMVPKMARLMETISSENELETTTSLSDTTTNVQMNKEHISTAANVTELEKPLRIKRDILVPRISTAIQQQLSAVQMESLKATPTVSTTIIATTEDMVTLSDDYDSIEDLRKSSILVDKMLTNENYEEKYFFK